MSRKRTFRKPKAGPTWFEVIASNRPIPEADILELLVQVHETFAAMRGGSATDRDFNILAEVLNASLVRSEDIGQPAVEIVQAGQRALHQASELQQRHGKYGFTGEGLEAMRQAIDLYEQILRLSTPKQMQLALQECMRRIRAGLVERTPA